MSESIAVWIAVGVISLLHCILLVKSLGGPQALVSHQPLITLDHSYHFYFSAISGRFFLEHGATWGYDPYMMAGYVVDIGDASSHLTRMAMAFLQMIPPEIAYKILVLMSMAVVPIFFFLAGLGFNLSPGDSLFSCLVGTFLWWSGGGFLTFIIGMFGFSLAAVYGVVFSALFYKYLQKPSFFLALLILIAGPIGILIHPLVPLLVVFPCGVLYLLHFRKLPVRRHIFIFAASLFAVATNLFWIIPYWQNLIWMVPHNALPKLEVGYAAIIFLQAFTNPAGAWQLIIPISWFLILTVFIIFGFKRLLAQGRFDLVLCLGISGLIFVVLTIVGNLFPALVVFPQPIRFFMPFLFLMFIPISEGLKHGGQYIKSIGASRFDRVLARLAFGVSLFLLIVLSYLLNSKLSPDTEMGLDKRASGLCDWIIANTDRSARVLLEDQGPYNSFYGLRSVTPLLIAYYTKRELIGGPAWPTPYKQHFADLSGFTLFGRYIPSWDEKALAEYMNYYNIGWAIGYSPMVRELFNRYPDLFAPLGSSDGFQFYRVNRKHTFFLEGSGIAQADYNRIVLHNVHAPSGRVVIGYHWHPRLWVNPPSRVVRVMVGRDPVGFVGIVNPRPEMVIEIKYWGKT